MKKPFNSWKVDRYFVIFAFTIAGIIGWFGPEAVQNLWDRQTVEHEQPIKASSKKNPSSLYQSLSAQNKEKVRKYIQKHGMQNALKKYNSTFGK